MKQKKNFFQSLRKLNSHSGVFTIRDFTSNYCGKLLETLNDAMVMCNARVVKIPNANNKAFLLVSVLPKKGIPQYTNTELGIVTTATHRHFAAKKNGPHAAACLRTAGTLYLATHYPVDTPIREASLSRRSASDYYSSTTATATTDNNVCTTSPERYARDSDLRRHRSACRRSVAATGPWRIGTKFPLRLVTSPDIISR
jgi:hypothetical protein